MLVNRLALVIVLGIQLPIRPGDGLGSLIRLESQVAHLMLVGLFLVAQTVVAEHQVVMRLQILGIDSEYLVQFGDCVLVLALEKKDPSQIVERNAIVGILPDYFSQMLGRLLILAIGA